MKNIIPLLLFSFCLTACGQQSTALANIKSTTPIHSGRVIFYNVENLFDTINDPLTNDEDFLPNGKLQWNTKRYKAKLKNISKVIANLCDTIQPMVVGLCEIENKAVLEDLIAQPALKKYNFGIAHIESEDERGIDAAFLYNKNVVEEIFVAKLKVDLGRDKTRDIVYFKAFMGEEFPIWFFVNHWPSRREGEKESESKRMAASRTLKEKIENLYTGEPYSRVVIMGDFNDNPTDKSMLNLSKGSSKIPEQQTILDLMKPLYENGSYSLKFGDENNLFDQFLVSQNLLSTKNKYYTRDAKANIFSPDYLLFNHPKNGYIPNRTFVGSRYVGGYSDHLPVYFDLVFK